MPERIPGTTIRRMSEITPAIRAVARVLHLNVHGGGPPCPGCSDLGAELVWASGPLRADPTVWLLIDPDSAVEGAYLTRDLAQQQSIRLQAAAELAGTVRVGGRVHGIPVRSQLPPAPEGVLS